MKRWGILAGVILVLAGLLFWRAEPLYLSWLAAKTEAQSIDERSALLAKGAEFHVPKSIEAPAPVVLMFHGCAGPRMEFQRQWAKVMNDAGYAAVIIDSTGPRGFSRQDALDIVCQGKALLGQERAGDVLAAYDIVAEDPRLDASRLVLAGWSHGAWSVMDFLTMDMKNRRPAGLSGDLTAAHVDGVILFYPHCGSGALSRRLAWKQSPPSLALIAGEDEIVKAEECIRLFEKRKQRGAQIDMTVYENANHVFDDPFLEPDWLHWYDEEDHQDAEKKVLNFLTDLEF